MIGSLAGGGGRPEIISSTATSAISTNSKSRIRLTTLWARGAAGLKGSGLARRPLHVALADSSPYPPSTWATTYPDRGSSPVAGAGECASPVEHEHEQRSPGICPKPG